MVDAGYSLIVRVIMALGLFAVPVPAHAGHGSAVETGDLSVRFDEPLENAAVAVATLYPSIRKELEDSVGWPVDFRPTVVLVRETARFQGLVGNPMAAAVAIPRDNLIVIDYSKMNTRPFTVEVTLKHELCHLLLERHIPGDRLPRWLNEGYCQWVTGGMSELLSGNKQANLQRALLANRLIPLSALSSEFPKVGEELILAYEESKSAVDYIKSEFGAEGIHRILRNLKEGHTVEGAVLQGLSVSLSEVEARWYRYLERRVTWFTYVAHNLYEILFFVAALLTVYGSVRLVIARRRRSRRADDEDEDREGCDG